MTFERAMDFILKWEGGYVNDLHDPGGETKFGITKAAYPTLDIKNLTVEQAIDLYRRDYWNACECSQMPNGVDLMLFDSAVNQGVPRAIRILQKACGVHVDGIVGAGTLAAAQKPDVLIEFVAQRMCAYGLVPQFTRYGLGWSRRLTDCFRFAMEAA